MKENEIKSFIAFVLGTICGVTVFAPILLPVEFAMNLVGPNAWAIISTASFVAMLFFYAYANDKLEGRA
jgi:hypothetical protein